MITNPQGKASTVAYGMIHTVWMVTVSFEIYKPFLSFQDSNIHLHILSTCHSIAELWPRLFSSNAWLPYFFSLLYRLIIFDMIMFPLLVLNSWILYNKNFSLCRKSKMPCLDWRRGNNRSILLEDESSRYHSS